MAQQAIPDEFTAKDGLLVKLFVDAKGDTVVRKLDGDRGRAFNAFTYQPHAIKFYHDLRRANGLSCADYTAPTRAPTNKVPECAEEDHDWDWVNPDDAEDRAIKCSKCGKLDISEDE